MVLLLGLFAAPQTALAQTTPTVLDLVSNLNQGESSLADSVDLAQSFTTGSETTGYVLTDVQIPFSVASSVTGADPTYTMEIWSATSADLPSTRLHTLTNPSGLIHGTNTFTAPAGTVLAANTLYYVVWNVSVQGANTKVRIVRATSANDDPGSAAGWSIGDEYRRRPFNNTGSFTNVSPGGAMKMKVRGYVAPSTDATLSALVVKATGIDSENFITFDPATESYETRVVNAIDSIDVTATVNDSGSPGFSMSMQRPDGTIQTISNPTSGTVATFTGLLPGRNRIAIVVEAEAGNLGDYEVIVLREGPPVVTVDPPGPSFFIGLNTDLELTGMAEDPDDEDSEFGWTWSATKLPQGTDVSGTVLSATDTQTVTFNAPTSAGLGTYSVTLNVADNEGTTNSKSLTVNVGGNCKCSLIR